MKSSGCFPPVLAALLFWGALASDAQETDGRWTSELASLRQHQVPEWLLDAKLGIQYVGAPRAFDDHEYWHWSRAQQRARQLAAQDNYDSMIEIDERATTFKIDYVWPVESDDPDAAIGRYAETGARFIVSMQAALYLGTEGLLMTPAEIEAARRRGLKAGLHYNFQRWGVLPSLGDPGYVNWMIPTLQKAIAGSDADFLCFDGKQLPSSYLRSLDLVSWYYNWADRNRREVWVNDDLGKELSHADSPGDVATFECQTMSGVSARPWLIWDNLRNEWNCWVNEYGVNVKTGDLWKWQYKSSDELLRVFIDAVSKGGGWLIQMVNTNRAWETLEPIGRWLEINGEAIYDTRPHLAPDPRAHPVPRPSELANGRFHPGKTQDWWYKWSLVHKEAVRSGPLYFNRSKDGRTLYAIHWGWPGRSVLIQNVTPVRGSAVRMLGSDAELKWRQVASDIIIRLPDEKPCEFAYSFKITIQ